MSHSLFTDASFFTLLLKFDEDMAGRVRGRGCARCGGVLDRADFLRKPRGYLVDLEDDFCRRRSFCCRADRCRRRTTPDSLRFAGRRVYLAVVILLVAAAHQGLSSARERGLAALLQVDRRTLILEDPPQPKGGLL